HTRFSRDWSSDVCSSDLGIRRPRCAHRRGARDLQPAQHGLCREVRLPLHHRRARADQGRHPGRLRAAHRKRPADRVRHRLQAGRAHRAAAPEGHAAGVSATDMEARTYYAPHGGLPPQTALHTGRAVFTEAYAVIPKGVMSDIVTSYLPFWEGTRLWILSRPLSGFSETFSQYIMEVASGGGSDRPEPDADAAGVLFVVEGEIAVTLGGRKHVLTPGGYAYLPPKSGWTLRNESGATARFHWIRKAYEFVEGHDAPEPLFLNEADIEPVPMPDTQGRWAT